MGELAGLNASQQSLSGYRDLELGWSSGRVAPCEAAIPRLLGGGGCRRRLAARSPADLNLPAEHLHGLLLAPPWLSVLHEGPWRRLTDGVELADCNRSGLVS